MKKDKIIAHFLYFEKEQKEVPLDSVQAAMLAGGISSRDTTMSDLSVTAELLERYSSAAPRYTSYPTAVDWSADFDVESYPGLLQRAAQHEDPAIALHHIRARAQILASEIGDPERSREGFEAVLTLRDQGDHGFLAHLHTAVAVVGSQDEAHGIGVDRLGDRAQHYLLIDSVTDDNERGPDQVRISFGFGLDDNALDFRFVAHRNVCGP